MMHKDKNQKNNAYYFLSLAISGGLIIGTAVGALFKELIIGSSIGLLFGIFFGLILEYHHENISKEHLIQSISIIGMSLIGVIIIYLIPILFSL